MKKLFNSYIVAIVIAGVSLICSSCEKEVSIDLHPSEPKLVIEGTIPVDSMATVKLSLSKNYDNSNVYPHVSGGYVSISDDAGNSEVLKEISAGIYKAEKILGVQGRSYNLVVEVDGVTYTSTSKMPYEVKADSLFMYYIPAFSAAYPMIEFTDPEGVDNYYRQILYIKGKRMRDIHIFSDEDRDGKVISSLLPFNTDYNNKEDIQKGDVIFVESQCIDKGTYTYFETLSRIDQSLANPTSNIKGGALGYFSAYTFEYIEILADW